MQFPTGGKVRERKLNRCDSGTDSTVWMEEDGVPSMGKIRTWKAFAFQVYLFSQEEFL